MWDGEVVGEALGETVGTVVGAGVGAAVGVEVGPGVAMHLVGSVGSARKPDLHAHCAWAQITFMLALAAEMSPSPQAPAVPPTHASVAQLSKLSPTSYCWPSGQVQMPPGS
jgi:hypothetical protein